MNDFYSPIDSTKPVNFPHELLVVEHYLKQVICDRLISYANWCPTTVAPVADLKTNGNVEITQSEVFIADRIEFFTVPLMREDCLSIADDIFRCPIKQHYGVDMEWFEFPHILRYSEGGNYRPHSDADSWDKQTNSWASVMDRDYSAIIYLNSGFSGGNLAFPDLNIRVRPRAGMLVVFPSDHRFVHTAEATLSGTRYAMVTWGAKQGGERVMNRLPNKIVRLDDAADKIA